MPSQIEITDEEIALSITKLDCDIAKALTKASKMDRVGRWEDAMNCMEEALASLRKIGVLESECDGVYKEAECGINDPLTGEFEFNEFVDIEFVQNI